AKLNLASNKLGLFDDVVVCTQILSHQASMLVATFLLILAPGFPDSQSLLLFLGLVLLHQSDLF
ncbi:MAG TPA: hypothetical protein DHV53_04565, partial [Gammaproteobacteria bacterium]|nr:hypothetical protein [Gammaproteobacteria bacterium]